MTTWLASEPISHPWFRQSTSKRKHTVDSPTSSRSPSRSSSPSPPPLKRRRQAILEAGFSSLSLSSPETNISGGQPYVPESNATEYPLMEDDDYLAPVVVFPDTVEKPDIPEVKMKSSSWYEPEPDRIVVTSLESSDEEDEETDPDTTRISISRALLQKLSKPSTRDPLPLMNTSQALVLYKPLPVLGVACEEHRGDHKPSKKSDNVVEDDDAMDVGP